MGVLNFAYDQTFIYENLCYGNFLHMTRMWFICLIIYINSIIFALFLLFKNVKVFGDGYWDDQKIENSWISTNARWFLFVFGFGNAMC